MPLPTPAFPQVKQHNYEQQINENYKLSSKVLGTGAKSLVKLGYSNNLKRNVAIKVISTKDISNKERSLVAQETKIMKRVSSIKGNLFSSYLDTVEDDANIYIVMELINGVELIDYCSKFREGLPEELAKRLFIQIVQSVNQLHENDICHLDIKLENVMYIRFLNRVKLIDFGFSNLTKLDDDIDHSSPFMIRDQSEVLQTHYCGTIYYTPPEVLREVPYNGKKADSWSLGVLLYCMLTLSYPFDDESNNFNVISEKIIHQEFNCSKEIPPQALTLIRNLLIKNPDDRLAVSEILSHPWFN